MTLKEALRKGFEIDPGFSAILDGVSTVNVTAVLDRTAVIEYPQALWLGRQLARLDRLQIDSTDHLTYRENKRWAAHQQQTARGREATAQRARSVKIEVALGARVGTPNRCPGSNRSIAGDAPLGQKGRMVACSDCGLAVYTYETKTAGLFKSGHLSTST